MKRIWVVGIVLVMVACQVPSEPVVTCLDGVRGQVKSPPCEPQGWLP